MILDEDLAIIAHDINNMRINNQKIVVTGATGLIGSLMVKGFVVANEKYGLNNKVFALVRNIERAKQTFTNYLNTKNLVLIENEITQPIPINEDIDFVFHTAAVTKSKEMIAHPVELIKTTVLGSINVLDFAKLKNAKSVVYLSSIEAFGVINDLKELTELDLGILDLTNIRNCYPESKRLIENYCTCYAKEYGLNVMNARLTQTFGAGASYDDSRIFGEIARKVIDKQNIILKTTGETTHDYCYTTDAINAVLTIAVKGKSGETYNIASPSTNMSIRSMAELVAKEFGEGKVQVKVADSSEEKNCYSCETKLKLNVNKIKGLGWAPRYDLKAIYGRLIESYREYLKGNHDEEKER